MSEFEHARRTKIGWQVVAEGGNQKRFAERLGISHPAAVQWLRRHELLELRRALKDGLRSDQVNTDVIASRLRLLRDVARRRGGKADLARVLGIAPSTITCWLRAWAPDGLDEAIADLTPEEADVA